MKAFKILSFFLFALFLSYFSYSQPDDANTQLFLIHEDKVLPSMDDKYRNTSAALVKLMHDNTFTGIQFNSFALDDFTYWYVSPIENMAELDNDPFEKLAGIAGKEKMESVFSGFDDTYFSHRDFIAVFHPDLSYKAEQLSEPGNNYREWLYLYYEEKHKENLMDLMKQWKDLFSSKNAPQGYAIYTNGLGHEGPVIVVHTWAKSREEHMATTRKRHEMLGEENNILWKKTRSLAYKIESKTGVHLPEFSYSAARE